MFVLILEHQLVILAASGRGINTVMPDPVSSTGQAYSGIQLNRVPLKADPGSNPGQALSYWIPAGVYARRESSH